MAIVNELVTKLNMTLGDDAKKAVDFLGTSITTIAKKMDKLGKVATAMIAGIGASMNAYAKDAREINQLAIETGNSVEEIQGLSYAFESLGADADDARGVLKSLNDSMYSVIQGEANEALLRMGITIFDNNNKLKNSSQIFMEISDKLSTMASKGGIYARDAAKWGKELGLSGDALQIALQGTDKIRGLQKEAQSLGFIFSKDKIIAGQLYYEAMNKVKNIIKSLYMSVMSGLVPELNKLTSDFHDWIKNSSNFEKIVNTMNTIIKGVVGGFAEFGLVVSKTSKFIYNIISKLGSLGAKLEDTEIVAKLVAIAMTVMAGSFVISTISPLVSILFKFSGVLLKLIPILWGFAKAHIAAFGIIGVAIAAIIGAGYLMYKNWAGIAKFFNEVWKSMESAVSSATDVIVDSIVKSWTSVKSFFSDLWEYLGNLFKSGLDYIEPIVNKVFGIVDKFKSGFSWVKDKLGFGEPNLESMENPVRPIAETAAVPVTSNNIINNTTNSQSNPTDITNNTTYNINVSGGSDPMKTARAVRGAMESYANEVNGG